MTLENSVPTLIGILWLAFWFYWTISAASSKPTIRTNTWWQGLAIRVALIILILVFLKVRRISDFVLLLRISNPITDGMGILLCIAGLAFAVWARVNLGANWGMPMSVKQNPELVTGGPYRFVRHPIYSGVLVAVLGTALALGGFSAVLFVFCAFYFAVFATAKEEGLLARQFPNEYPAYVKRTKKLIPFVW